MWVGPIVSTPLSYGWSLTRLGFFGWMKLLRTSGTIGKTTATTRKIATGPKDSSIDQTPDFDGCGWLRRTPDRSVSGVGKPEGGAGGADRLPRGRRSKRSISRPGTGSPAGGRSAA